MKGKKNDYSMTFYKENERVLFLGYVHNTDTAIKWVKDKNITWTHAMVYDRRTREKIERIKNPFLIGFKPKMGQNVHFKP